MFRSTCILLASALVALVMFASAAPERDISQDTPSNQVRCWTTKGRFTLDIYKSWAPNSAKHFVKLVKKHYYDDQVSYGKFPGTLVSQFGQHFSFNTRIKAQEKQISDEDRGVKFKKGSISFASGRNTVVFIADEGGQSLGSKEWERPFGIVTEGLEDVVSQFYGYDEKGSFHSNYTMPAEAFIHDGKRAINAHFPHLDVIVACRTNKAKDYEDEHHQQAVEQAVTLRQRLVEAAETPDMKLWYHSPSDKTVPDKYVAACKDCTKKGLAFCVSELGCVKEVTACMSPSDGIEKLKACTKKTIFKKWPAQFKFPTSSTSGKAEL